MEVEYSNDKFNNRSFTGFIGEITDLSHIINDINKIKLKRNIKVKRIIKNDEDLKMLGLSKKILKTKIKDLSESEYKLVLLIKTCALKPNIIILNNFDLGFNYKTKSKISKYIKTINALYNINFIIITNDLLFINKNAKHIIIAKNEIIKYQGDILTAIKQGLLEKLPIIDFIDLAREKNKKIEYTLDKKELLRLIYRSVF